MPIYQSRKKDIVIDKVVGIKIFANNKIYYDAISGIFNMTFGYSCKYILNEIKKTYDKYPFHPKEHFYTKEYIDVSKYLLNILKMPDGGILFLNSGSEAVEAAISMSLQYHKLNGNYNKTKIITRNHSYHGATLGARSVTGRNNFGDLIANGFDTIRIEPPFCSNFSITDIEKTIIKEGPSNIAAFIFEPVNHLKGMYPATETYLKEIRALCSKYNILMIIDEIISGMYRTGNFLYIQQANIMADIIIIGKGISSGYSPVSAVISNKKITDSFSGNDKWKFFSHSHTYAANPISIASIKATYEYFNKIEIQKHFFELIKYFNNKINILKNIEGVIRAESVGLLAGINIDKRFGENIGKKIEDICFENGVIIRGEENWITIAPSYNTSLKEIDFIIFTIEEAIITLTKKYKI